MKVLLIHADDRLELTDLPDHHRSIPYKRIKPSALVANVVGLNMNSEAIIYETDTFEWRGQWARRTGRVLCDMMEEV